MKRLLFVGAVLALSACEPPHDVRPGAWQSGRDGCDQAGGVLVWVDGSKVNFRRPICIRRDALIESAPEPVQP